MYPLNDKEVESVRRDLKQRGITMPGLEDDLLDHLLCSIENYISLGMTFDEAYKKAFYDLNTEDELKLIQNTTIDLINEKKDILKNLSIYLGVILGLIGTFKTFTIGTNPALILACLSLVILFIYHSCFLML